MTCYILCIKTVYSKHYVNCSVFTQFTQVVHIVVYRSKHSFSYSTFALLGVVMY